jgi:Rrf2 family protein
MQVTRAADYAVRAMVHLSSLPEGARASLAELADAVEVPAAFLSKVLQQLAKGGLVTSHRGKRGGFELAREVTSVSLLDILRVMGNEPALNPCLTASGCDRSPSCAAHTVWLEAQERMMEVLASASLEHLARITRARRRIAAGS